MSVPFDSVPTFPDILNEWIASMYTIKNRLSEIVVYHRESFLVMQKGSQLSSLNGTDEQMLLKRTLLLLYHVYFCRETLIENDQNGGICS